MIHQTAAPKADLFLDGADVAGKGSCLSHNRQPSFWRGCHHALLTTRSRIGFPRYVVRTKHKYQ